MSSRAEVSGKESHVLPVFTLPLGFTRQHQQHLRSGLHQWSTDPEWATGPREPLLQLWVHPDGEGEVLETPWSRRGEHPDGGTNPGLGASGGIHSCEPSFTDQGDLVQPLQDDLKRGCLHGAIFGALPGLQLDPPAVLSAKGVMPEVALSRKRTGAWLAAPPEQGPRRRSQPFN